MFYDYETSLVFSFRDFKEGVWVVGDIVWNIWYFQPWTFGDDSMAFLELFLFRNIEMVIIFYIDR